MTIRPAKVDDESEVRTLVMDTLTREFPQDAAHYASDDVEHVVKSYPPPENIFLVAQEGGHIIGTCGVKADGPATALLRRFFVAPTSRRRGVGKELLEEALRFCRTKGFQEIIIRTSTRMEQAIRLCRSLGFQEGGSWVLGDVTLVRFRLALR